MYGAADVDVQRSRTIRVEHTPGISRTQASETLASGSPSCSDIHFILPAASLHIGWAREEGLGIMAALLTNCSESLSLQALFVVPLLRSKIPTVDNADNKT
jgi:hypothetical protein